VTDEVPQRLSAALRAQASGLGTGPPPESAPDPRPARVSRGREPAHAKPRMSASAVLGLVLLLGAVAGGLAGVISTW
jgi:hypothetical protein